MAPLTFAGGINISKEAQHILQEAQAEWCPSIAGSHNTFSFDVDPATKIILGTKDEEAEVIDFQKIISSISSGGATGGHPLIVIVSGGAYNLGVTQDWEITKVSNIPLFVLFRHDSFCNLPGAELCVQTFIYDEGKLSSLLDWGCGIRNYIFCYKKVSVMESQA